MCRVVHNVEFDLDALINGCQNIIYKPNTDKTVDGIISICTILFQVISTEFSSKRKICVDEIDDEYFDIIHVEYHDWNELPELSANLKQLLIEQYVYDNINSTDRDIDVLRHDVIHNYRDLSHLFAEEFNTMRTECFNTAEQIRNMADKFMVILNTVNYDNINDMLDKFHSVAQEMHEIANIFETSYKSAQLICRLCDWDDSILEIFHWLVGKLDDNDGVWTIRMDLYFYFRHIENLINEVFPTYYDTHKRLTSNDYPKYVFLGY